MVTIAPMGRSYHRLRRLGKWAGAVACLLTFAAWALTAPLFVRHMYVPIIAQPLSYYEIRWGVFDFHASIFGRTPNPIIKPEWHSQLKSLDVWADWTNLSAYGIQLPRVSISSSNGYIRVSGRIPLPFLLLVFAIPTALLWYRDHGSQRGCCRICDYNLTGNTSGVCPECGTPISLKGKKLSASH